MYTVGQKVYKYLFIIWRDGVAKLLCNVRNHIFNFGEYIRICCQGAKQMLVLFNPWYYEIYVIYVYVLEITYKTSTETTKKSMQSKTVCVRFRGCNLSYALGNGAKSEYIKAETK